MLYYLLLQVVIARGKAVVVTAVDQKLRELRTLKQHYYPEACNFS